MRLFLKLIPLVLLLVLLASIVYLPTTTPWISMTILAVSIGTAIFLFAQKHWKTYQQAECTREKMIRSLVLDLVGFLLAIGAAMYAGGVAGRYLGLQTGPWIGLMAGFTGGFVAAWVVRSAWGKYVLARVH